MKRFGMLLVLLALSPTSALADIVYQLAPTPCRTVLLGVPVSPPCTSIRGFFTIDDAYVPGTSVNPINDPDVLDWSLGFFVDALGGGSFGFSASSALSGGGLAMPVLSGPAFIRLTTNTDILANQNGFDLTLSEHVSGQNFQMRSFIATEDAIWTRVVPEPGTLALLALVLPALVALRRRVA